MTVHQAARVLGTQDQFVRVAMQTNQMDIGACAKLGKRKQRFAYVIVPEKLAKFMNITTEELERRVRSVEAL